MEIADCKPAISYTCRNGFLFHHKVIGIILPLVQIDSDRFWRRCCRKINVLSHALCHLFTSREDDTIAAAEVHKREETEQAIVIGIEITVGERLMLRIPQGIDELATLLMTAHQRGGGRRGHEPDAVTEHLAGAARRQYLVFGRQRPVDSILVDEIVDALGIEEVLYLLAVLSLPLAVGTGTHDVGTAPLIVERDVHGHAP